MEQSRRQFDQKQPQNAWIEKDGNVNNGLENSSVAQKSPPSACLHYDKHRGPTYQPIIGRSAAKTTHFRSVDQAQQTAKTGSSENNRNRSVDFVINQASDNMTAPENQEPCSEQPAVSSVEQPPEAPPETPAKKPARRRRLAHRRQYNKSRRAASSYLRSQFVRYDSLIDSSEPIEASGHWTTTGSSVLTSHEDNDATQCMIEQSQREYLHSRGRASAPNVVSSVRHLYNQADLLLVSSLPTTSIEDNSDRHVGLPCTCRRRITADELQLRLEDCSSSSLDSFSPAANESVGDSSKQTQRKCGRNEPTSGTQTMALSLSSLANLNQAEVSRRGQVMMQQQVAKSSHPSTKTINSADPNERVVRSETVDHLSRSRVPSESPKSKFFPSNETLVQQHATEDEIRTGNTSGQQQHLIAIPSSAAHQSASSTAGKNSSSSIAITRNKIANLNLCPLHHSVEQISPPTRRRTNTSVTTTTPCIDNVHFNDLFHGTINDSASVTVNQSVRTDPRLHKDDIDIKFSRALNSCKLPQIRYASKERLFERLTDLRFLSIDFLNTFLLTYRVFTSAEDVLEALKSVHYNSERYFSQSQSSSAQMPPGSARESFSIYANSSMSSLNTSAMAPNYNMAGNLVQHGAGSKQLIEQTGSQHSVQQQDYIRNSKKSSLSPKSTGSNQQAVDTIATNVPATNVPIAAQQRKGSALNTGNRPLVPPRSPHPKSYQVIGGQQLSQPSTPSFKGNRLQSNAQIEDAFLLSPGMQTLSTPANHQKRRSTISSLTPITGSTASSLANLTAVHKSPAKGGTFRVNNLHSNQHSPKDFDPSASDATDQQQISPAISSISCLSDREDPTYCGRIISDNFFQVGPVVEAETASGTISGSSSLGIELGGGNTLHRVRSSSVCVQPGSRQPDEMDTLGNSLLAPSSASQISLTVPTGRQVRASSFSHVSDVRKPVEVVPSVDKAHADLGGSTSAEHWRMSYKKNCAAAAAAATSQPGRTPAAPTAQAPVSRTIHWHLDPAASHGGSSINLGDRQNAHLNVHHRRASADVRLRVTLEAPADDENNMEECLSSENATALAQDNLDPNNLYAAPPSVPPSSPIDPEHSPLSEETPVKKVREDKSTKSHQKSKEAHRKRRHSSRKHSSSSSSSSLDNDEGASSSSNPPASSGSSPSTKSVVTSHSESGLIQTSSDSDDKEQKGASNVGTTKSAIKKGTEKDKMSSRTEQTKTEPKKFSGQTHSMILKEIDLTQTSTIDCDTSADEDKIETTSDESTSDDDEIQEDRLTANKGSRVRPMAHNELSRRLESVALEQVSTDKPEAQQISTTGDKRKLNAKPALKQRITSDQHKAGSAASIPSTLDRETQTGTSLDESGTPTKVLQPAKATTPAQNTTSGGLVKNPTNVSSSCFTTPRSSFQHHTSEGQLAGVDRISKAGVVVTGSAPRVTSRRSSTASAASAFAAATAASNNPLLTHPPASLRFGSTSVLGPIKSPNADFAAGPTQHLISDATQPDANQQHCSCNSQTVAQRGSVSSMSGSSNQQRALHSALRSTDHTGVRSAYYHGHHPSCALAHQVTGAHPTGANMYQVAPSDASSQCNSRASSRLSSCAGLESSSQQINSFAYGLNQQQGAHNLNNANSASGSVRTSFSAAPLAHPATRTPSAMSSVGRMSKRNSAQINVRSVATIRVLSVLRHWVSKHSQDFINDTKLSYLVQEFLQDLINDLNLLPAEHKAAIQLQQMVQKSAHSRASQVDLDILLAPPTKPSPDSIETLSALEIAEGMTYLDHKIFLAIRSEEFLGQAWMKTDKAIKAPHILLITKRFNDVSRLVSSEIIRVPELHRRVAIIEKWANVAHICRVVHNFNGVLQICAAFTNSAVFRLKKTWEKIPKTTKTTIDQLQNLVSTDSRFRNMRDAISRCDPPSIPYVGMYLTDLSFIEEGTPNYSPEGLLNFSKMRMIAHVIREIQHLQNGNYKIDLNPRVANYLLDSSRHLQDDEMYRCSLAIEPRYSGTKNGTQNINNPMGQSNSSVSSPSGQQTMSGGHHQTLR